VSDDLPMWTVFERPDDYPDGFIARLFLVRHSVVRATTTVVFGDTLDDVRAQLPPDLYNLGRQAGDKPSVVETWI
jgi:hypothetical protein